MTTHFEGRELKSYAEPITSDELREGEVYFFVNYVDEAFLIPTITTVVFAGRNLEEGDENQVYFQDVESYMRGVRYDSATADDAAVFECGSQNELGHVFDYEHALNQMLACSLRRKNAAPKSQ
jgi:hypothetical protein